MSNIKDYKNYLAGQIVPILKYEFKYVKSKHMLKQKTEYGYNVIVIGSASKYSPYCSIYLHFGVSYNEVIDFEKKIKEHQSNYQIYNNTIGYDPSRFPNYKGPRNWEINLDKPDQKIVYEIYEAIKHIVFPFFKRFNNILAARDALAKNDPMCFSANPYFWSLLYIDIVLNDLDHFKNWMNCLRDAYYNQANDFIKKYELINKV